MIVHRVEISIKTILTTLLILFGIYVLSRVTDIIILLSVSFVLMTALHPLVTNLQKLRFSREIAVLLVYVILIALLVVAGIAIIPPLIDQTTRLFVQFDIPKSPLLQDLSGFQFSYSNVSSLISQYGASVLTLFAYVTSTFSLIFSVFTVLVMSLYLLLERDHLYRYSAILFRHNHEERSRRLLNRIEDSLGGWVRGQIVLMFVIGILTYVGLTILGIPYAVPLAILAGVLEMLPNLGPTLSAIPAILIAAITISPTMGAIVGGLYIVIQFVENNIVVPQIMKKAVGISPITSIVLILVGVRFGGIMGAILIIPAYIVLRVILEEFSAELKMLLQGRDN